MRTSMICAAIAVLLSRGMPTVAQTQSDHPRAPSIAQSGRAHWGAPRHCPPICPIGGPFIGNWCGRPPRCPFLPWIGTGNCTGYFCDSRIPPPAFPPIWITSPYFTDSWFDWGATTRYYDSEPVQFSYRPPDSPARTSLARRDLERPSRLSLVVPLHRRKPLYELAATQSSAHNDPGQPQLAVHAHP